MIIRLQEINLFAYHGVYTEERERGTTFKLHIELELPLPENFEDELENTVDYVKVYEIVHLISTTNTFQLLETWANKLAAAILTQFQLVRSVRVVIQKPGEVIAPNVGWVEVEHNVERE